MVFHLVLHICGVGSTSDGAHQGRKIKIFRSTLTTGAIWKLETLLRNVPKGKGREGTKGEAPRLFNTGLTTDKLLQKNIRESKGKQKHI